MTDKAQQVKDQCRVVAHLARVIADVHEQRSSFIHPELLDIVGNKTAALMEELGDILNNMDAVDDEDEWTDPIFEKAHELFPQPA